MARLCKFATAKGRTALFLAILAAAVSGGCGRSEKDFRPAVADARTALEAALDAWKSGAAQNEPIKPAGKPGMVVQLFDSDFTAGKKLVNWTIESGEMPAEGPSQFKVKLELVPGKPPVEATFYVTGISQNYSIFRDRDYQQRAGQM